MYVSRFLCSCLYNLTYCIALINKYLLVFFYFVWLVIELFKDSLCLMLIRDLVPSTMLVCVCILSCVWLCDPKDSGPPCSSVHGVFQARILQWLAISCSKGSFQPRDRTCVSCRSLIGRWILYPLGNPHAWQIRSSKYSLDWWTS